MAGAILILKRTYGNKLDDTAILKKVVDELNVVVKPEQLKRLYDTFADLKIHDELVNMASSTIGFIANPTLTVVKSVSGVIRKFNEWSRLRNVDRKKAERTIKELEDYQKKNTNLYLRKS